MTHLVVWAKQITLYLAGCVTCLNLTGPKGWGVQANHLVPINNNYLRQASNGSVVASKMWELFSQRISWNSNSFFVFLVSMVTVTLCSRVVSVSKKSDNSEGQIQNTVWFSSQTRRIYYNLIAACHFINLFGSSQKKFCYGHQHASYW